MNRKNIYYLLAVIFIILNTSCGNSLKHGLEYLVDNPTDKEIVIQIDDKEYSIPAKTSQTINITQGKHTLTYNGSSANFVTKVNSNVSSTIINPTLSNYILYSHFYIKEGTKYTDVSDLREKNSYEYMSDEGLVKLPLKVLNNLFIEHAHHHWSFDLDQDAEEETTTIVHGRQWAFHKLYRYADYIEKFANELPVGIVFPVNTRKLNEQPVYVFPIDSLLCDCDAANTYVKELESKWNKMIANPSDISEEVGALVYNDLTISRKKLDQQCGTQFNPGRDDQKYQGAMKRLHKELDYLSDTNTFIVR